MRLLACLSLCLFLFSCGQEPSRVREFSGQGANFQANSVSAIPCGCTSQFDPVCSAHGIQFANACIANCYGIDYSMGACAGGTTSHCNEQSGHVCAQPPRTECEPGVTCPELMPHPRAYANECVMMQAGASLIHMGLCK